MGDISGPLRWVREVDKRIEELERQSQESSVREDNRVLEYRRKINGLGGRLEKLEKLHYKDQPYPEDHNYPEPTHSKSKPHTCGECKFFKNREDMLAGDCWRWKEGRYSIFLYSTEKPDDLPCSKFEPREGLCTD